MNAAAFHIIHADWNRDREALRRVREAVFVQGQQVPVELEWDGLDSDCEHVLALDAKDQPIGTARLTSEHAIGRMAVLAPWRGHGVGRAMLEALLERAREHRCPRVTLHAQVDAIDFYRRFGFHCHGAEFIEAGIRHRHMALDLAAANDALVCDTWEQGRKAVLALLARSRHSACVQSARLLPRLLDHAAAFSAMKRIACSGRGASLRWLVRDTRGIGARDHRLVRLYQRLPSFVQIRVATEDEDQSRTDATLLNDTGGFLHYPRDGHPQARGYLDAPGRRAPWQEMFEQAWQRSAAATNLRILDL